MIKNIDLKKINWKGEFPFYIDTGVLKKDFEIHTHSFIELVVILGGQGVHVVGEREFELKAGDVFVVSGYLSHGFKNCDNLHICNLMFDMRIFEPFLGELKKLAGFQSLFILEPYYRKQHEFNSRLILDQDELTHVQKMIALILNEYNEHQEDNIISKIHFLSVITFISRMYTGERNLYTRNLYFMAEAVSYMEKNYTYPIKIDELAERAHLSKRHFTRVFTQNYHLSPIEYILQLRLQHAQKLLKSSEWNISQCAVESGFYDLCAFSHKFKTEFGISPREYRQLHLGRS